MKRDKRSDKIKKIFGKFLREERIFKGLSLQEVGYILNIHHSSWAYWETGINFPRSIVHLKKIHLLFPETPKVLSQIFGMAGVKPTKRDCDKFEKIVEGNNHKPIQCRPHTERIKYKYSDNREHDCRRAFGRYLRSERLARGLSGKTLAKAFGMCPESYYDVERGCLFLNDIKSLLLIDLFYGNALKVLFGLCSENGIHLSTIEMREFASKLSEFENTAIGDWGKEKVK